MIETIAHLGPEMQPKFIKIEVEISENPRNHRKRLFSDGVDFWLILRVAQKHEKRVMIEIRGFTVGRGVPRTGTFRRVNPPRGRLMISTGTHLRRRWAYGPANFGPSYENTRKHV